MFELVPWLKMNKPPLENRKNRDYSIEKEAQVMLVRIVREIPTNAIKQAQASTLDVTI